MEKQKYLIKFGSESKTADGVSLEEAYDNALGNLINPTEQNKKSLKENIKSERDYEKDVLAGVINIEASKQSDLRKFRLCLDLMDVINNSTDEVILDDEDLDIINKGFKAAKEEVRKRWVFARKLFRQLDKPEKYCDDAKTSEPVKS